MDDAVVARTDDLIDGVAYEYSGFVSLHRADSLGEVRPTLRAAEAAARGGHPVVGFVAYEAAGAFDPALRTRPPQPGLPLVLFAEFRDRRTVTVLDAPLEAIDLTLSRRNGSEWYCRSVERIRAHIELGDVYQVNLTDRLTAASTEPGCPGAGAPPDPVEVYRRLIHAQRGAHNVFLRWGSAAVACASPESFFEFDGESVVTRPMKGTARRAWRTDADRASAAALAASEKDRAENVMIVDLLRNDLARIAPFGGVTVERLFEVERFETVWQMTSTVRGRVKPGVSVDDVFAALFPCGSVTGAPKVAAMGIIRELEDSPRGIYCGAVGTMHRSDDANGIRAEFAVGIRTAYLAPPTEPLVYGAGGGITWSSDPEAEEAELRAKTAVLTTVRREFELLETMRLDRAGVRFRDEHLERLADSAEYFGFRYDRDRAVEALDGLARPDSPHRARLTLARDGSVRVTSVTVELTDAPVRLAVAATRLRSDDPMTCHKTTDRRLYDQARCERPDVDDVLLVNERDEIVETTIASVVFRLDGRWWTPPLESGGLAGIGRRMLVEAGLVTPRVFLLAELPTCEELHVVSALRGRRPARLIGACTLAPTS